MGVGKRVWILAMLGALVAVASPVWAAEAQDTASLNCSDVSQARARELGDEARRQGAHQRAAECYLAAGEPVEADRSFVKASLQQSATTSQKLASNLDDTKSQARRMRQAFRSSTRSAR